jgi:hypothetical protein
MRRARIYLTRWSFSDLRSKNSVRRRLKRVVWCSWYALLPFLGFSSYRREC